MKKSANLSSDRMYRYSLFRGWGDGQTLVTFILLNPSTADETEDDPTVRRCIGYAQSWGFDAMLILNLFAYRTKDPADLLEAEDPVGPINDVYLGTAFTKSGLVVAGWGVPGAFKDRAQYVTDKYRPLYCLGTNRDGSPKHPLYLKSDTFIEVFSL